MNENQWSLSSLMYKDNGCIHNFSKCSVHIKDRCEVCIIYPPEGYKYNCSKCDLFLCYFCASSKYGVTVHKEEEAVSSNNIEIPLEAYQCGSLSIQDMLFIFRQLKEKIDKTNDYMALITELQLEQGRLRQEIFDLKNDLELNKKGKQKIGIHIEENPKNIFFLSPESLTAGSSSRRRLFKI